MPRFQPGFGPARRDRKGSAAQQFANVHHGVGKGLRNSFVAGAQDGLQTVACKVRFAVNFDDVVTKIDNPNFGNSGAAIGREFFFAVIVQ